MASTQAQKALETFERFLASLDLESYQQKYRPIKTVEQDLPRELNPLPDLYEHYWNPSCYPSIFWAMRPRLWARTKESTLMTKPSWVTA